MFDFGLAMQKKGEFETARLIDFEFRRRARTSKLLARSLGVSEEDAINLVASTDENDALVRFSEIASVSEEIAAAKYRRLSKIVHAQLVAELGDPSPHRLA